MSVRTLLIRSVKRNVYTTSVPMFSRNVSYNQNKERGNHRKYNKLIVTALFGSALVGAGVKEQFNSKKEEDQPDIEKCTFEAGDKRPELPTYRAVEVSKHDNKSSFWVTYKHGVYDVTKFLTSHPGGEQILNAGGLSVEPFWNVYGMHKTKEVFQLLEQHRIGNLHDDDIVDHSDDELWVKEPYRDKRLIVKTAKPFNAEIPPKIQIEHFDTPNELFYVRQHMPVPDLDAQQHTLRVIVKMKGTNVHEFSLQDLEKFPQTTVRAALMCAGNRRSEMDKQVKPVKGISWTTGAISNAVWKGVALVDVLAQVGAYSLPPEGRHIVFTGSDVDATGENFSTSIPLHMALDPASRILLATHMNGKPLPPDHGYPLRVIVPGAPAVRSVKWLESITISEDESSSHWHQKDYRGFNPSKTWETADFSTAPPVYSLPVTSAICDPQHGEVVQVKDGCIEVRGYAYSGGGAAILRVDVSSDGGASWREARPQAQDKAPPRQHYSWTLWTAHVPVDSKQTEVELWVKATDSNFNTQPEKFEDIWNIRGILANAYHKIKVKIKH